MATKAVNRMANVIKLAVFGLVLIARLPSPASFPHGHLSSNGDFVVALMISLAALNSLSSAFSSCIATRYVLE